MTAHQVKMKHLLFCILFFLSTFSLVAEPYYGQEFKLRQPDGTFVSVKVYGDEFYQRVEDLQGYTLVRNPQSWICYATHSADKNELIATTIRYTNDYGPHYTSRVAGLAKHIDVSKEKYQQIISQKRSEFHRGLETEQFSRIQSISGKVNGLTLLIDFSDQPAIISSLEVDSMMNHPGYNRYDNYGSVKDYFTAISGGKLEYTNSVLQYYRAKKPKAYYDDTIRARVKELVMETLQWARDSSKFDFSKLSTDDSARVKSLNILYAGIPAQGWGIGLWPHASGFDTPFVAGPVKLIRYQMTNIGFDLSIGTIVHENGHMVCKLPDLYDYQHDSKGVGFNCIMAMNDRKIPQPFCAPYLLKLGWITPKDLTDEKQGTVFTCPANAPVAFLYRNKKDSCEYYMIEAKTNTKYNTMVRDQGLFIWHVDTNRTRTSNNNWQMMKPDSHYVVSMMQADNLYELEKNINMGNSGDAYSSITQNRFNDFSTPSSKWWNDSLSGFSISSITAPAETMSFVYGTVPLSLNKPLAGDTLFSQEKASLFWNAGSANIKQVSLELSTDNGLTFTTVQSVLDNSGSYKWLVPLVRSSRCFLRISDIAKTMHAQTGPFCITQKPEISLDQHSFVVSVIKNKTEERTLSIKNKGKGVLNYSCEIQQPSRHVMINELFASDVFYKYPQNGFEIYNSGTDIDMSGWRIESHDNVGSNKTFTFPDGYILKGNRCILFTRMQMAKNDSVFFYLIDWHRTLVTKKSLNLSISLFNRSGVCVDFVKTVGNTDEPPYGTTWNGPAIAIDSPKRWPSVYRNSSLNTQSASNWSFDTIVTPNVVNKGQTASSPKPHWMRMTNAKGTLDSLGSSVLTVLFDASNLDFGTYTDTLLINHNCKQFPNPLSIPATIKVTNSTAIVDNETLVKQFDLQLSPNPVRVTDSRVHLSYADRFVTTTTLSVYDALGQRIYRNKGIRIDQWNLCDTHNRRVVSGMYLIELQIVKTDGSTHVSHAWIGIKQ